MTTHLVAHDLTLGVVFEVTVALETALDKLAEIGGERLVVEEMMHAQAGARRLGRVRGTNSLLRRSDARAA